MKGKGSNMRFDGVTNIDAVLDPAFVNSLPLPESEKKRYTALAKEGLTYRELDALLDLDDYTPVIITFDIQRNHRMSKDQIDTLLAGAAKDLQDGMMAKEVGVLLMKGLAVAVKAAASGAV